MVKFPVGFHEYMSIIGVHSLNIIYIYLVYYRFLWPKCNHWKELIVQISGKQFIYSFKKYLLFI